MSLSAEYTTASKNTLDITTKHNDAMCIFLHSYIFFQHQKAELGTASMILCCFPSKERAIKQGDKQRYFNTIPSHYPNYCAWTFSCILHFVQLGLYSGKLNLQGKPKSCILCKRTPAILWQLGVIHLQHLSQKQTILNSSVLFRAQQHSNKLIGLFRKHLTVMVFLKLDLVTNSVDIFLYTAETTRN